MNTVIFRHHGVLTSGGYQFTAFFVDERTMRVVRREVKHDSISVSDITDMYNLTDAHNCISIGCDHDGFLHLAYGHHSTRLRYRRSTSPLSVTSWTEELPMTGINETRVTYPCFLAIAATKSFLFLYRDGASSKGALRIKEWRLHEKEWEDRPRAIVSGALEPPLKGNPYWNHPAVGRDGTIHLSYVWRKAPIGEDRQVNNVNIDYCRSQDGGTTWQSSEGTALECPITLATSRTITAIPPGANLINQCSMALDDQDRPHIVFYSNDDEGIPQYRHLWFDGVGWKHSYISKRVAPFRLVGGGTLKIPISRPEIVIDSANRVYVIYRADITDNRMIIQRLLPPDYDAIPDDTRIVWGESLEYSEPVVDRTRWQQDARLSMLIQKNSQPHGDGKQAQEHHEPIYLLDLDPVGLWGQ